MRDLDLDFLIAALVEPLADDRGFLDFLGKEYLFGQAGSLLIELLDKFAENLIIVGISVSAVHQEIFPPDHLAAADEEDLDAGLTLRPCDGDHIRVDVFGVEYHAGA